MLGGNKWLSKKAGKRKGGKVEKFELKVAKGGFLKLVCPHKDKYGNSQMCDECWFEASPTIANKLREFLGVRTNYTKELQELKNDIKKKKPKKVLE